MVETKTIRKTESFEVKLEENRFDILYQYHHEFVIRNR